MAVKVKILNKTSNESRECIAANELKRIIQETLPDYVNGIVYIAYSITMCGQDPRDLDVLLACKLDNYVLEKFYTNDKKYAKKDLVVEDFCCAIELKEHVHRNIEIRDSNVYVHYNGCPKNATEQNEGQRYSLKNYLYNICNVNVITSNFIWLKSLSETELRAKCKNAPIGALPSKFTFRDIVNMCILQDHKPYYCKDDNRYHLSADLDHSGQDYLKSIKDKIFTSYPVPSSFTMNKVTSLMEAKSKNLINNLQIGEKGIVFNGKPGTGKTFYLVKTALELASGDHGNRCLILTYNHALVSDIRRLLYFMDIPDAIDTSTVQIKTLHSFFMQMMKTLGVSISSIYGSSFDREYHKALKELHQVVIDLMDDRDVQILKDDNELAIDWDYIMIDEAQDWFPKEKEILEKVYGPKRLIIADGGPQYNRRNHHLNWSGSLENLAYSRRQKAHLVDFVNRFAKEVGLKWSTKTDGDFIGGEVIIRRHYKYDLHKELIENCKQNGCNNYEALFLVPPSLTVKDDKGNTHFKNYQSWYDIGIKVFDGTNYLNRERFSINPDECRLFQYESCRGLEGWVTACLQFDKLMEYKLEHYEDPGQDELVLESDEERKMRIVNMWMLIPLTRAIDTLVITLKDPQSEIGQILKRIADDMSDFVHWDMDD